MEATLRAVCSTLLITTHNISLQSQITIKVNVFLWLDMQMEIKSISLSVFSVVVMKCEIYIFSIVFFI